ncbi:MAG: MFS transporter [Nocardioidaceae bacterium]|nr:MFS transporter [Nocardioidaceae bacterium]
MASKRRRGELLAATGPTYFPIALVARLPYSMMVVGVLILVVEGRGSLALGGLNSALVGLGVACVGPLSGAAADRFGQRPVLLLSGAASSASLGLMAWVVHSSLPDAAVLLVAFTVGACAPQVAPMSRSRLVQLIGVRIVPSRQARTVSGTMAYESAADETVFIVGPVMVGLLATLVGPTAAVVVAAALTLVFVTAFALHPTSEAGSAARSASTLLDPARALLHPAIMTVVTGIFGVGLFFGSSLTWLTSLMDDQGRAEIAGLLYGVMGIGSTALALAVALFPASFGLGARWLSFASVLVGGSTLLLFTGSTIGVCLVLLVLGIGIGPTMVTLYSLGAQRSPAGRSSTVMTMLGSGVIVGQSTASALTGVVGEAWGTDAAGFAPLVAALVVLCAGLANQKVAAGPGHVQVDPSEPLAAESLAIGKG